MFAATKEIRMIKEKYKVIGWSHSYNKKKYIAGFNLRIDFEKEIYENVYVDFELFYKFIENNSPNLKEYMDKYSSTNNAHCNQMYKELEELGFDFNEHIQMYVNEHINENTLYAIIEELDYE
jgi:hypothetical protein